MFLIDDQPISTTFFNESKWLTEFITPKNLEVNELYKELTRGARTIEDELRACWKWVATKVEYKKFIRGTLRVGNKVSVQNDLWMEPALVIRTREGNCANKSFLLASLLRNCLGTDQVFCVLGNLHNGAVGGHAWVEVNLGEGYNQIMETTRSDIEPLIPAISTDRYESIHYFNDEYLYAIPGRTLMKPFSACYSTWLKSYLDWAYIEGRKVC